MDKADGPPILRLIPARAGKTLISLSLGLSLRAHPRAGGENRTLRGESSQDEGSSPRGRGKQIVIPRSLHESRLIPARAGKTGQRSTCARARRAHPRAGGENSITARIGHMGRRLIPARAGKTSCCLMLSSATRAHPRAGGENFTFGIGSQIISGSSPRGRGKQRLQAS